MDRIQGQQPGSKRDSSVEMLGPYALLAEIGRGDLTTVHLAQKQGTLGFQRLVAIKRLSEVFARQPDFVHLMLDEARLGSRLHHANVVGILDVGSEPSCYVVMDYVEGESLGTLLSRAGNERQPRFIAPVLVDMLNGLHAVHTAIDENGAHLAVVHQAPTAHHVLVGIDGTARLTDFSQARSRVTVPSAVRSDRLRVAYMAPEHALTPNQVDHRADLFVVGIVLWEALTGERLFAAETDELTFQNLVSARIPRPSEAGLKPPRCFDHVAMRALERDPERRYQSALEMARDLRDAALNQALYATAGELGQWVTSLVGPELVERRKRAVEDPSLAESDSSTSGFYSAQQAALENPYQSGRIYGGSYSHVDRGQDVVRTPGSLRSAATVPSLPPVQGRQSASPSLPARAPDRASITPSGARISGTPRRSMPPLGMRVPTQKLAATSAPVDPPPPPARPAMDAPPRTAGMDAPAHVTGMDAPARMAGLDVPRAHAPTLPFERALMLGLGAHDNEHTNPGGFVPTRPGGRRDANAPGPGAYSEHKTRAPVFDEVDTSRLNPPPSPSSYPPPPMSAPAPQPAGSVRAARRSDPTPRVTEQDGRAPTGRRDSPPLRLSLPEGPVGQPYRATPEVVEPPPRARGARQRFDDVMVTAPNSIAPSLAASRTKRPEAPDVRSRGYGFWLGTGLLTGIIALAAFVGVRNWATQRHAAGHGTPSSVLGAAHSDPPPPIVPAPVAVEPPAPAVQEPPAVPEAAAPTPEQPAAPAPSVVPAEAPPAQPTPAAGPRGKPGMMGKLPAPAKPALNAPARPKWQAKKPALKAKPSAPEANGAAEPASPAPAPAPEAQPAPAAPKPARKAALPDNPY